MITYHQAILDALNNAGSTSQNPTIMTDIFSHCRQVFGDEYDVHKCSETIDAMYEQKILNSAFVLRDGKEGNYYWPTAKSLQPAKWSSFRVSKKPIEEFLPKIEVKPLPTADIEVDMPDKPNSAKRIRELIKESPGIAHDDLIIRITGDVTDAISIKKAVDMINYVLNQGNFTSVNKTINGKTVKCYYSDHDRLKEKEKMQEIVKNEVPTLEQHHQASNLDKEAPTEKTAAASALDIQEGGSHYKDMKIQPVQYIIANDIGFIEGNVIKYVSRWKNKNGVQDLKKARHFLDILIEQQSA